MINPAARLGPCSLSSQPTIDDHFFSPPRRCHPSDGRFIPAFAAGQPCRTVARSATVARRRVLAALGVLAGVRPAEGAAPLLCSDGPSPDALAKNRAGLISNNETDVTIGRGVGIRGVSGCGERTSGQSGWGLAHPSVAVAGGT